MDADHIAQTNRVGFAHRQFELLVCGEGAGGSQPGCGAGRAGKQLRGTSNHDGDEEPVHLDLVPIGAVAIRIAFRTSPSSRIFLLFRDVHAADGAPCAVARPAARMASRPTSASGLVFSIATWKNLALSCSPIEARRIVTSPNHPERAPGRIRGKPLYPSRVTPFRAAWCHDREHGRPPRSQGNRRLRPGYALLTWGSHHP